MLVVVRIVIECTPLQGKRRRMVPAAKISSPCASPRRYAPSAPCIGAAVSAVTLVESARTSSAWAESAPNCLRQ